jgi:hypothetical protein
MPSEKPRFLQRCVADLTAQTPGGDLGRAFAICQAQAAKSGYRTPGANTLTKRGAGKEAGFAARPDMGTKSKRYERAVAAARAEGRTLGPLGLIAEDLNALLAVQPTNREIVDAARALIGGGPMPNGRTWRGGAVDIVLKITEDGAQVVRTQRTQAADGTVAIEARWRIAPSRSGGAGITIEGPASEYFLNFWDDAQQAQMGLARGFDAALAADAALRDRTRDLVLAWALDPTHALPRLVGWRQVDRWRLVDISVEVQLRPAVMDPVQRGATWLAKYWEVYVPIDLDVRATVVPVPGLAQ